MRVRGGTISVRGSARYAGAYQNHGGVEKEKKRKGDAMTRLRVPPTKNVLGRIITSLDSAGTRKKKAKS